MAFGLNCIFGHVDVAQSFVSTLGVANLVQITVIFIVVIFLKCPVFFSCLPLVDAIRPALWRQVCQIIFAFGRVFQFELELLIFGNVHVGRVCVVVEHGEGRIRIGHVVHFVNTERWVHPHPRCQAGRNISNI